MPTGRRRFVAWALYYVTLHANAPTLPFWSTDLSDLANEASRTLGAGTWAWIGGASLLASLGLIDPGQRKPFFA
jgi:hypothetical protein